VARDHKDQVQFFGVAWKASADECRAYLRDRGVPYPAGLDQKESVFAAYRVAHQPVTVLVTRDGHVAQRFSGPVGHERLESAVADLIST
jgi:hypothetical protein